MAAAALREQLHALLSSMFSAGLVDEQFQQLQMLQDGGGTPGFVAEVVTLFCDDAERIIVELSSLLRARVALSDLVYHAIASSIDLFLFGIWDAYLCREQPVVDFDKVDAFVHQLKGSSASVGAQKVKFTCMQFRQFYQEKSSDGPLLSTLL